MTSFQCPHCKGPCHPDQRLWHRAGVIWHRKCAEESGELKVTNPRPPASPPEVGNTVGLGDIIEQVAKPIAKVLKMDCLDDKGKLKPDSPCGKRKSRLNRIRF